MAEALDKYVRPVAWALVLDYIETRMKADSGVAALLTKTTADRSSTYVDVAQGSTPNVPAPCVRLNRDEEGEQPLTTYRGWGDEMPPKIVTQIAIHAQATVAPRDANLSAASAYELLRNLESVVVASLRRMFAQEVDIAAVLGAPYSAHISASAGTDKTYWPTVASVYTVTLNKRN